jgi:DNA-binding transcriptional MerR regulator
MPDTPEENLGFGAGELDLTGAPAIRSAGELPAKLYFRIGEVASLTGLKQHVLRYWETEFPSIAPKKMGSNHRMYRRKDVEFILEIKHLLYEKRYTIEGARKHLEGKQLELRSKALSPQRSRANEGLSSVETARRPSRRTQTALFGDEGAEATLPGTPKQRAYWKAELAAIQALLES